MTRDSSVRDLLTPREIEVVRLLAKGFTAREVAGALNVAVGTVRTHRKNIFSKTRCRNTTQLVVQCVREGLI